MTLLIYGLVLLFTPLLALNSLISGRYVEGVYKTIPVADPPFSDAERMGLALVAIHFLESQEPAGEAIHLLAAQSWPGVSELLYEDDELNHMIDVKHRVAVAKIVMWLSGLGIAAIWVWARQDRVTSGVFWESLQNAAAFVMILSLGVSMVVVLFWPLVNIYFHAFLFHGLDGNWQFPAESGLITLFPMHFWFSVAMSWIGRTIGIATVGVLVAGLRRHNLLKTAKFDQSDSDYQELLSSI